MTLLRYTLLSEGSSDQALMPILTWLLDQHFPALDIKEGWVDLRRLRPPPRDLKTRIRTAIELLPCDLLFVHRDSNAVCPEARRREIFTAFDEAFSRQESRPALIPVVPVRMMEAWLLFDEAAVRWAAKNTSGTMPLQLPPLDRCETIPDPKAMLEITLRKASGLSSSRRRKLPVRRWVHALAGRIGDFEPLRRLAAFRKLEEDIRCYAEQF
jgi:hypothetical protein